MKHVTSDRLQELAWQTRRYVEVDHEQGIAVLTVGGTTYYADLPELEVPC